MTRQRPGDARDDAPADTAHVPEHLADLLRSPAVRVLLAVLAAGLIFWFGTRIGQTVHGAFGGDTGGAITFGALVVLVPAVLVALGAGADRWVDTRRGRAARDTGSGV